MFLYLIQVGAHLLDVVLETHHLMSIDELPDWVNALGLLLSNLPEVYSDGLTQRLVTILVLPDHIKSE